MSEANHAVEIEQSIGAPAPEVARYIGDFRHARDWMVGVETVEKLAEDSYRLTIESPVGKLSPEVRIVEHGEDRIRWEYASTIEGGGEVTVARADATGSCLVTYKGDFSLKGKILNRAARLVGMDSFARRNGERSLLRLKQLMEARRYR